MGTNITNITNITKDYDILLILSKVGVFVFLDLAQIRCKTVLKLDGII